MHFNVHILENRYPILFEPFALKDFNTDSYQYDIVNYQQADQSIANFLKYLANFIFYRFGLEVNWRKTTFDRCDFLPLIFQICYITTVIVIGVRLDALAVFYAVWLGLFLISGRRAIKRMWPFYILFLLIAFPLQYMSAVGAPPFLCFSKLIEMNVEQSVIDLFVDYPWTTVSTIDGWPQLRHWLYLPDYLDPPLATILIGEKLNE